ncbi:MAG TPA: beta-propeller domain-containing protein [Acidimicrobiales bacterium]|nr:beta-propeller domain-containing protein [Acidimicrobiales bacterium]
MTTRASLHRAAVAPRVELTAFDSCPQLLTQVRTEALAEVGPSGLVDSRATAGGYGVSGAPGVMATNGATGLAAPAAAPSGAGTVATGSGASSTGASGAAGSTTFSTTNDQEQGVDEADLAKTDGSLIVSLRQNPVGLQVTEVGGTPRLAGFVPLGSLVQPTGLFLTGHNVVVVGSAPAAAPQPASTPSPAPIPGPGLVEPYQPPTSNTEVVVVDVTDANHPVVARSFSLQGAEVDVRLIAGHVEVVVQSAPRLGFVTPSDATPAASAQALADNRQAVMSSSLADWLPSVTSTPGGQHRMAPCTDVMHTADASSGLDTVSVVPIDPQSDTPGPEVSVVGDASTVYASTSSLYVATPGADGSSTSIFGFDLSDPSAPRYLGGGTVPGTLIGQYALSEYRGYLRVATTVGAATPAPGEGDVPTTLSDNRVTVLGVVGGALVPVGTLGGLGAGEKIYAVRFIGPLGYVVTFRQTDPLYVLDLSDPNHPQASGQLPLTGYSSFLEPLGPGLLLGVGQEVDPSLRTDGLQVSLFDVSDPAHPALVSKDVLAGASSSAENDPHALLYWASANLVVMPVTQYPTDPSASTPGGTFFDGAVVFHVGPGALSEAGRITQPSATNGTASGGSMTGVASPGVAVQGAIVSMPPDFVGSGSIERALVVGSMIYTVSDTGILASDLTNLSTLAWLPYP